MIRSAFRPIRSGCLILATAALLTGCHDKEGRGIIPINRPPGDVTGRWTLQLSLGCSPGTVCPDIVYASRYLEIDEAAGVLTLVEFDCCGVSVGGGSGIQQGSVLQFSLECRTSQSGGCQYQVCEGATGAWDGTGFRGEFFRNTTFSGPADSCPSQGYQNTLGFSLRPGWGACPTDCTASLTR